MDYGDQEDDDGEAVGGLILGLGVRGCAREKKEEEEQSRFSSIQYYSTTSLRRKM